MIVTTVTICSSFYYWRANQRTKTINILLLESLIEANKLVKNSNTAYKVFGDCVSNQNICEANTTKERLLELNNEKINIEKVIQDIQIRLQPYLRK